MPLGFHFQFPLVFGMSCLLLNIFFFQFKMFVFVYTFEIELCVHCYLVCIFVKLWF